MSKFDKIFWSAMVAAVLFVVLALSMAAHAQTIDPLKEVRYCGTPVRLVDGSIRRRSDVLTAFQKAHPCPATMQTTGACPGWQKNHVVPLACGGCDAVWNLAWLPTDVKTCSRPHCIDRIERKINASSPPQPDTAACVNVVVP